MNQPKPRLRSLGSNAVPDSETASPKIEGEDITHALVERARSSDMHAWARLYQDHFDGLYRHLRYLTGECQTAEELVQETFVQALSCIDRYDGRARFSTWLHGIGLNMARKHWRSQRSTAKAHAKFSVVEDLRGQIGSTTPDQDVLARQRVGALYDALEQLPIHLREAFILRELEGLSQTEAAAQLGITTNNLAVRSSRARARIRRLLGEQEP
jgi:RNA polymerase sigma-70 factor (ECF subfamily)